MMDFVHERRFLRRGDIVVVACSQPCNERLTDDVNFERFGSGRSHNSYGGFFREMPARIPAPDQGHWNVTVDLGGVAGTITHRITVVPAETDATRPPL